MMVRILRFAICFFFFMHLASINCTSHAQDKLKPGRLPSEVRKSLKPGLLAEYLSIDGKELLDADVARMPAILLQPNEPATPFVAGRDFRVRMDGYLKLKLKGSYRISAIGNGTLELKLNGKQLIATSGKLKDFSPASIDLVKGYNRLEVSYQPPKEGETRLRIYWENESFEKEPIPPTMLFYSPGANQVPTAEDLAKKVANWNQKREWHSGRELVLRHNCLKCHNESQISPLFESRDSPNLKMVVNRLNKSWLQDWLLDPQKLRNDISMPRVFSPDEKKEVGDLTEFLLSLRTDEKNNPANGDVGKGGDDFENIGCIGCHHFEKPDFDDEYNRISLYFTGAKFRSGKLAEFLSDSRAHYQWSRMPKFRLTKKQTVDLESFIRSESKGVTAGTETGKTDVENGRKLFTSRGCVNCHAGVMPEDGALHSHTPLFKNLKPGEGCLSPDASKDPSTTPVYQLSDENRAAINSLIKGKANHSFLHINLSTFTRRQIKNLRCATCHDLDDEQATLPYIIEEEGAVGLPPNRVPMLTFAGEKLLPDWSEKLLAGKLNYRVREHFRVQMPGFPVRGVMIAEGLSQIHGFSRDENTQFQANATGIEKGKQVAAMETGLSCNRCHAIADRKPNAAFDAQSTNLIFAAERLRKEYYLRWMFDPLRIDKQTKMPRFSEDRKTTSLKGVEDGDARRQFEVLWQYLNSLKSKDK